MIAVAILGILIAIAVPKFSNLIKKSHESTSRGNLAMLRSSLAVYYGENTGIYPVDDLTSLVASGKYMAAFPILTTLNLHNDSAQVVDEIAPSDSGNWSYNNVNGDLNWGAVHVGCTHTDTDGTIWSSY
jgi:general secretion pathway protein G